MSIDINSLDVKTLMKIIDDQIEKGNISAVKQFADGENHELRTHFYKSIARLAFKENIQNYYEKGIADKNAQVRLAIVKSIESLYDPLIKPSRLPERQRKLEILKKKMFPILYQSLKDTDKDVLIQSIVLLTKIGDPEALGHLVKLMKSESKDVRNAIAWQLPNKEYGWGTDENARPALVDALKDSDKRVKLGAIHFLPVAGESGYRHVLECLKNKDPDIRIYSCRTLALSGDPQFLNNLLTMTKDSNQSVREAALDSVRFLLDIEHAGLPTMKIFDY